MVSGINGSNGNQATSAASSASAISGAVAGNTLGQDAFLKILMAQIQHQDPLQPMDDTTFVTQLAQFSSLEQQVSTNQLMQNLVSGQQAAQTTQDAGLVGHSVTVSAAQTVLGSGGLGAPVSFALGSAAQSVTVSITDASGNAVRTMNFGAEPAGMMQTLWNGQNDGGTPQPPGTYNISVSAKDASGNSVVVSQQATGIVQSLSLGQGGATLVLDNGVTAPTSSLISVGQ
jgi:flagellar basal-body rod modification protein FlgD